MSATVLTNENAPAFYASRLQPSAPALELKPPGDSSKAADEPSKDGKTGEPAGQPKKPIQPRINELVSERNEARDLALTEAQRAEDEKRQREKVQRDLDEANARIQVLETRAPQTAEKPRPTRAEFPTDETFQEALTDWKVDKRLREREAAEIEERRKTAAQQIQEQLTQRLNEARQSEGMQDFDEVVGKADTNVAQHLYEALAQSDVVGPLAYHLAKHPEEVRRLNALPPARGLAELGRLEARIVAPAPASSPAPAPAGDVKIEPKARIEVSKAPRPPEPLKNASESVTKDPKDMSFAEFKAWRRGGSG